MICVLRNYIVVACAVGALTLALVCACLPADDRPVPGNLTLTVAPSTATLQGFTTADDWSVRFERVLIAVGRASFNDLCTSYSEANYDRIFDLSVEAPQKLSTLYGIGDCDLRFGINAPSVDALLGDRVTEADKTQMRSEGSDPYAPRSGIALLVRGNARKGDVQKTFEFAFRPRVRFDRCNEPRDEDGGEAPAADLAVHLRSGETQTARVRIEVESLFRDDPKSVNPTFRFGPFADADKNGDGVVTLEELRAVPVGALTDAGAFDTTLSTQQGDAGNARPPRIVRIETLADFMYILSIPLAPRLGETRRCASSLQIPTDGGGGGGR
jgi:hypothetical protein